MHGTTADPLVWLESYLDDPENSEIYTEAFGEKAKAAKAAIGTKVANAQKAINEFIDKIIAKIRELSQAVKLKFAQLSFKRSVSKLGKNVKKQIAGVPYLSAEVKAMGSDAVKIMAKFANAEHALYLKYMAGKMTAEEYGTRSDKLTADFDKEMAVLDQKISVYVSRSDSNADAVSEVTRLLQGVDVTIQALVDASVRAAEANCQILEQKKKTKITEKSPGDAVTVSNRSASKLSAAFSKVTSFINKVLKVAATVGDKALRKAASAAKNVGAAAGAAIENHKAKKAAKKAATESMSEAAAAAAEEGKEEDASKEIEEAYDDVMYTMNGVLSEILYES